MNNRAISYTEIIRFKCDSCDTIHYILNHTDKFLENGEPDMFHKDTERIGALNSADAACVLSRLDIYHAQSFAAMILDQVMKDPLVIASLIHTHLDKCPNTPLKPLQKTMDHLPAEFKRTRIYDLIYHSIEKLLERLEKRGFSLKEVEHHLFRNTETEDPSTN